MEGEPLLEGGPTAVPSEEEQEEMSRCKEDFLLRKGKNRAPPDCRREGEAQTLTVESSLTNVACPAADIIV